MERESKHGCFGFWRKKGFLGWNFFLCVCVEIQRGGDRLRKRIKWFWFLVWVDCWIFSLFFVFAEYGSKEKDLGLYALLSLLLVLVYWDSLSLGARIEPNVMMPFCTINN